MVLSWVVPSALGTLLFAGPAPAPQGVGPTAPSPVYPGSGLSLLAQVHPDAFEPPQGWGTKCWGYTSPAGREYAVLGTYSGVAFVELTDPGVPVVVGVVPSPPTHYRTVRTYDHYAYSVGNSGGGVQVIDLGAIDAGVVTQVASVGGGLNPFSHNLDIDETSGFLYRVGFETGNPGLLIYDLEDPALPALVGSWLPTTHDVEVVTYGEGPHAGREIGFACTNAPEGLTVLDLSDKTAPVVLAQLEYPNPGLSHQVSLSEDLRFAFLNDESDGLIHGLPSTVNVFSVANPDAPAYLGGFTNGNPAMTHDGYVRGSRLYCANYTSGLRVFDVSLPTAGTEVAWFDTWPCEDSPQGGAGLYSVYPHFPSGVVIGADIQGGLFVWHEGPPRLTFGYPQGLPTSLPPVGAELVVSINELVPGELDPSSPRLEYDLGGDPTDIPLTPTRGGWRAALPPLPCGAVVRVSVSARTLGGVTWRDPQPSATGAAFHRFVVASSEQVLYADSFEQPSGWITYGAVYETGAWEQTIPVPSPFGPAEDHTPAGIRCWLTENEAFPCSTAGEVTGGPYWLVSPPIDLSGALDPHLRFARWFNNTGGDVRDDPLRVELSAGTNQWVTAEVVGPELPAGLDTNGGWVVQQLRVRDHVQPSAAFQVRFVVADDQEHGGGFGQFGGNSLVEAAIDDVELVEPACDAHSSYCAPGTSAAGCQALLSAVGLPSASAPSGFTVTAQGAEGQRSGLYYFGTTGKQALPWGASSSLQCVAPPVKRFGLSHSGGTAASCDGSFVRDLNASWCPSCPESQHNPGAGALVQLQLWYRDPASTSPTTTSLSDALELLVGP